jgi:uncharacterized protein YbaP (TraB family)
MRNRFRLPRALTAVVAALLCSASVISAQAPVRDATRVDKGLIWKVEREGRIGWLVGSLHLLTADFYPLPAAMGEAFASADTLVEEIDLDEAANPAFAATVLAKAFYPAGMTLSTQLTPDTYKLLTAWLAKTGLGIDTFQPMKPWMVALTLQTLALQRAGFDPAFGIDKHYDEAATKAGKQFLALETAAEQIALLDGLSPRTQDLMLRETVESTDAELTEVKAIMSAWRSGDASAVERLALTSLKDAPEIYQLLLADRNHRWMPKIEGCLEKRRCFVVVGAAHLVGPDGLVTLLRQRGYKVEQK